MEIPRPVFFLNLGRSLFERSGLFDRAHLNEIPKREFMLNRAIGFIAPALESEDEGLKKEPRNCKRKSRSYKRSSDDARGSLTPGGPAFANRTCRKLSRARKGAVEAARGQPVSSTTR